MAASKPTQHFLHVDPERTDYTVTEAELEILERGNAPLWKDVVLFALPLAASTLFNAYGEAKAQTGEKITFTVAIFINSVIGMVSAGFFLLGAVAWWKSRTSFKAVVEKIKKKPRFSIPASMFTTKEDVGEADPHRPPRKKKSKGKEADTGADPDAPPEAATPPQTESQSPLPATNTTPPATDKSEGDKK